MPTQEQLLSDILRTLKDIKRQGGTGGGGGSPSPGGSSGGGGGGGSGVPPSPTYLQQKRDLENILQNEQDLVVLAKTRIEYHKLLNQEADREIQAIEAKIARGEQLVAIEKERYRVLLASKKLTDSSIDLAKNIFGADPDSGRRVMSQFTDAFDNLTRSLEDNSKSVTRNSLTDLYDNLKNIVTLGGFSGATGLNRIASVTTAMYEAIVNFSRAVSETGKLVFFLLIRGMASLALQLSDAEAAFRKATGANEEFGRSISRNFATVRAYGISIEEVSEANKALYESYSDFTLLSATSRDNIAITTAILGDLGLSGADAAASMMSLTKSMGMGPQGAAQAMLNMERFSRDLGVPFSQLSSQFASVSKELAKLGSNGELAFKRLAITAKVTGISIERLMAITSKFDTFEGAATAAGKLNAALGGNFLNSMDLMMATDPVDRFNMIRDAIDNAGLSFDTMGYYQREFIAQQAGLENASELALVMKGRYDLVSGAIAQNTQEIEDAATRAQTLQSFQEKLTTLFIELIPIVEGGIDLFTTLGTKLVQMADVFRKAAGGVLVFFGAIAGGTNEGSIAGLFSMLAGMILLTDEVGSINDEFSTLGKTFKILKIVGSTVLEFFRGMLVAFDGLGLAFAEFYGDPTQQQFIDALLVKAETFATQWGPTLYDWGVKFAQAMVKVAAVVGAVGNAISTLISIGRQFKNSFSNLRSGNFQAAFAALGGAFKTAARGLAFFNLNAIRTQNMIDRMATEAFNKRYNPRSFYIGIKELAEAFVWLTSTIANAFNPMISFAESMAAVGQTFHDVLDGIKSFYTMIADETGVQNIKAIAEEVRNLNVAKAAALTGLALSTSVAAATPASAIASGTSDSATGQETVVQQPITIRIGDQTLDDLVLTAVGKSIRKINLTQR